MKVDTRRQGSLPEIVSDTEELKSPDIMRVTEELKSSFATK